LLSLRGALSSEKEVRQKRCGASGSSKDSQKIAARRAAKRQQQEARAFTCAAAKVLKIRP
jgi:hypothetical protein